MRYRKEFQKKYLNINQSLKYQIMLILMEEHKRARLGKVYIGNYFGDDCIQFNMEDWKKICKIIERSFSKNHRLILEETKGYMNIDEYIYSLIDSDNYCYKFYNDEKMEVKTFTITAEGYSYQFNGYMKSQDRANKINNKIQKWLLVITSVASIYYIGSWFKPELNLSDIVKYEKILLEFIENILEYLASKINFFMIVFKFSLLVLLNFYFIEYIASYLNKKIDGK